MGLAELFNRSTVYTATNTTTGASETWTVVDGIAPDWAHGDYSGGMSIPGASRAALLLAELIGSVPWAAYRTRAGTNGEKLDPTPPLLEQPAPPDTRMATFSSMALDLVWNGNAVALVAARNSEGWPTAILPVPAEYVQVKRLGYAEGSMDLPSGSVVYNIGGKWYPATDVVHVKGPCRPGALRGRGVLENHLAGTLRLAEEQAKQARAVGSSGIPTGILKSTDPDFEEEDAKALKAAWVRNQRERTIAVLNATTEFTALAWNPTETQLLDARRFSLHEIALIFGLDPSWLGVSGDSMTYANIEQQAINLVKFSLRPHLVRFEQALSQHLPRGTWAEANLDALLRADTLTRYQAHAIGLDKGFLTLDEVREMERRPPLTPAQRVAARPAPPAAPAGQDPTSGEEGEG